MNHKLRLIGNKLKSYRELQKANQQEQDAWQRLKQNGGMLAVTALKDGFNSANQYRNWDIWSLYPTATIWIADLICQGKVKHLVEFGAGYSTIVLSEFVSKVAPNVQIDTFEHQPEYAERIEAHLPYQCLTELHCADLFQLDDSDLEQFYTSEDPNHFFAANAFPVPKNRYHETRLRNVFYHFDFRQWENDSIDLILLDGPNGNGRSISFPLLRHAMRLPGWVLVDDYLDYPFLDDLHKVYVGDIARHVEANDNEFVLVSLSARL